MKRGFLTTQQKAERLAELVARQIGQLCDRAQEAALVDVALATVAQFFAAQPKRRKLNEAREELDAIGEALRCVFARLRSVLRRDRLRGRLQYCARDERNGTVLTVWCDTPEEALRQAMRHPETVVIESRFKPAAKPS